MLCVLNAHLENFGRSCPCRSSCLSAHCCLCPPECAVVKNGDNGERVWGAQCSCCLQEQAFALTLLVAPSLSLRLDSETTEAGPPLEKWRMCQGIHAPLLPLVEGIMAVLDAGSVAICRMHASLFGTAADGLRSAAAEATAPRRRLPMRNRTAIACSAIASRLCAGPGSKTGNAC